MHIVPAPVAKLIAENQTDRLLRIPSNTQLGQYRAGGSMKNPLQNWLDDWKKAITLWVAAVCLTILAYGWMNRPFRYERFTTTNIAFDKRSGEFYETKRGREAKEPWNKSN